MGTFYTWPLTWAGIWNGHNQNPGDDRVVFNQDGVYLGVLTRRTDAASLSRTGSAQYRYVLDNVSLLNPTLVLSSDTFLPLCRWCAATNNVGVWASVWMGSNRGWDYPGQPPDGEGAGDEAYQRPDRWLTAATQRTLWYKVRIQTPSSLSLFRHGNISI